MVYNELCHKEIDWSKAMKQLLITLVAVVLGITAMSSYAKDNHKARVGNNPVNVLSGGSKAGNGEDAKKRSHGEYLAAEPSEVQPNRPGCGHLNNPCDEPNY